MEAKHWYMIIGFALGWATKIPFLYKWYKELRQSSSYEKMRDKVHLQEMKDRYNKMFPDNPIK